MPAPPDFRHVILDLAKARPLYHSEADFQHALAWHLHSSGLASDVRLEVPFRREDARSQYLDLLVAVGSDRVAIELKYKTRKLSHTYADEAFEIQNHGAQDLGRYDFLLDVQRIERFVKEGRAKAGLAVLLTNDPSYWSTTSRSGSVDQMFRLDEGRVVSGTLSWLSHASTGTTKGRTASITLRGTYCAQWLPYSTVTNGVGGQFRVLVWHIVDA